MVLRLSLVAKMRFLSVPSRWRDVSKGGSKGLSVATDEPAGVDTAAIVGPKE
jgi:hypothetical protein